MSNKNQMIIDCSDSEDENTIKKHGQKKVKKVAENQD